MQNVLKKQQGLTLISLIFILGLIAFFVLLTFKIVPIYTEHGKVTHALAKLKNTPDIEKESKRAIRYALIKQFDMNYVYHVEKENIDIISRPEYLKVQIVYHVKVLLAYNLSVWVDFDESIEIGTK